MLCPKCTAKIPDDARFCISCGASLQQVSDTPPASPEIPPLTKSEVDYANFWERAVAFFIDFGFVYISFTVLFFIIKFVFKSRSFFGL